MPEKITGGGLCQVSWLMLCWWVYKTSSISFPLQLIKPYASTCSKVGQESETRPARSEHIYERFY